MSHFSPKTPSMACQHSSGVDLASHFWGGGGGGRGGKGRGEEEEEEGNARSQHMHFAGLRTRTLRAAHGWPTCQSQSATD